VDVPFCAFEFRGSFAHREVENGRSCCGCEFPIDFTWNWRLVMLDRMVDGGGGYILVSIDPLLH
jgi:hypothetical protein